MFRGGVNVASPTNGKTIVAIPAGFQVQNDVIMSTTARVTATGLFIPITLYISYSTQTIVIQNVPSSLASIELSFEGCSYFYYYG